MTTTTRQAVRCYFVRATTNVGPVNFPLAVRGRMADLWAAVMRGLRRRGLTCQGYAVEPIGADQYAELMAE
jgi:hypothetical protein